MAGQSDAASANEPRPGIYIEPRSRRCVAVLPNGVLVVRPGDSHAPQHSGAGGLTIPAFVALAPAVKPPEAVQGGTAADLAALAASPALAELDRVATAFSSRAGHPLAAPAAHAPDRAACTRVIAALPAAAGSPADARPAESGAAHSSATCRGTSDTETDNASLAAGAAAGPSAPAQGGAAGAGAAEAGACKPSDASDGACSITAALRDLDKTPTATDAGFGSLAEPAPAADTARALSSALRVAASTLVRFAACL